MLHLAKRVISAIFLLVTAYVTQVLATEVDNLNVNLEAPGIAEVDITLSGVADLGVGVIDIETLEDGIYTVNLVITDTEGSASQTVSIPFSFNTNMQFGLDANITAFEVFIDTDPGEGNAISLFASSPNNPKIAVVNDPISTSGLSEGLHSLYLRVQDSSGLWSPVITLPFLLGGNLSLSDETNIITNGRYQLNGQSFMDDIADDGAYDSVVESITEVESVSYEYHVVEYEFTDSFGNVGSSAFSESRLPTHISYDTDRDGLLDSWELEHFGHLGYDGLDNPDDDNQNNFQEFYESTSPGEYEGGGFPQISGRISSVGETVQGVSICITNALLNRCHVVSDHDGTYNINPSMPLPKGEYVVFV